MNLNIIDIIIIIYLISGSIQGMTRGLTFSLLNAASIFVILYFGKYLSTLIAGIIIKNTPLYNIIRDAVSKKISSSTGLNTDLLNILSIKGMPLPDGIASMIINVLSLVILLIAIMVVVRIVGRTTKEIFKKAHLGFIDNIGGLLFGLAKSVIIVFLAFAILIPLTGLMPQNSSIISSLNSSRFAKYFVNYNFIFEWLKNPTIPSIKL